jgi:hypothetical protein
MATDDAEKPKGRLKLPEPLASDLLDFRAANYRAQESEVVQEALIRNVPLLFAASPFFRQSKRDPKMAPPPMIKR